MDRLGDTMCDRDTPSYRDRRHEVDEHCFKVGNSSILIDVLIQDSKISSEPIYHDGRTYMGVPLDKIIIFRLCNFI